MKIYEFDKYYPDEESCKQAFKEYREKAGIVCPKCGCTHHYWINKRGGMYECAHCHYRQSLKANTIMHGSNMPYRIWFLAMHLITATKHSFSALELQRQIGWKYYQPMWEMVHKIREAMGKRDAQYVLKGNVEIDEGFFATETPAPQKAEKLKQGAGSQRQGKVLVMAESKPCETSRKGQKGKQVGHIKMLLIPDLKALTIAGVAGISIDASADLLGDASTSHALLNEIFNSYTGKVIAPKDIEKVLPWVHIVIGNARSLIRDLYHGVKREYLQAYLYEFCYKFNRRYFGENLFDRLLVAAVDSKNEFMHRTYDNAA